MALGPVSGMTAVEKHEGPVSLIDSDELDRDVSNRARREETRKNAVSIKSARAFLGKRSGRGSLHRDMNTVDATALLISGIIGSGIFVSPSAILEDTGSFGVSMMCWIAGACISICGSLCYIELGLFIPHTGGDYLYILQAYTFRNCNKWTELFGSLLAFLYLWTNIFVIRPASMSIIALTCSYYFTQPFFIGCEAPKGALTCLALSVLGNPLSTPLCFESHFALE